MEIGFRFFEHDGIVAYEPFLQHEGERGQFFDGGCSCRNGNLTECLFIIQVVIFDIDFSFYQ